MKKFGLVLLGAMTAFVVNAQDPEPAAASDAVAADAVPVTEEASPAPEVVAPLETSADTAAPAEAAADGAVAADAAAATEAAPADAAATAESSGEAPVADASAPAVDDSAAAATETVPVEEAAAAPAEESKSLVFYVGADAGRATVSVSNLQGFPKGDVENDIVRGRIGMRLLESVGLEAQVGVGKDKDGVLGPHLDAYYGIYVVPTGTLLDVVEFAFPLGYAFTKVENGDQSENIDSPSYGMNIEFPLRVISESLPDIRIGGGGMVYAQKNAARAYGFHAGLRFDFGF